MKRFSAIMASLLLVALLTACGGDPNTASTASTAEKPTSSANSSATQSEVSLVAIGRDCTITVPKLETFFNGYAGATVKYNNPEPNRAVYVNLYKDNPNLEVNVSVEQLTLTSAETQDAKGYAEYYNSRSKKMHYDPVELAGYSGYLATDFLSGSITTDHYYLFDYPLSNGSSIVLKLWVTQRYDENTAEMKPIAEAFLKNIKVAPKNS